MKYQQTIKIKVCGMRETENILEVVALQPDFMGFIFYKESPRYVGDDFKIPNHFPDSISRVGVFVNQSTDEILQIAKKYGLDYLQLHGSESVEQVKFLSDSGLKIIKAFAVEEKFDFSSTQVYQPYCKYFLFDTKGKYYGGNASVFDWLLLKKYNQDIPFFLSGGLNAGNIGNIDLIKDLNIYSLDVNSGVEEAPGYKSVEKVKQFMQAMNHPSTQGENTDFKNQRYE